MRPAKPKTIPKRKSLGWKFMFGTPEERSKAASEYSLRRFEHMTPAKQKALSKHMASITQGGARDPYKLRCDCGVMTLKRASTRGRTAEHERSCRFHPRHPSAAELPLRQLIALVKSSQSVSKNHRS